jgi:hypothetical protein
MPIPISGTSRWTSTPGCVRSDGEVQALGGLEQDPTQLRRRDLPRRQRKQGIVASVHIEALWDAQDPVGETRWLETLDKSDAIAGRYVAPPPSARRGPPPSSNGRPATSAW